ncbi:MAG: hypothetical protein CO186_05825 [Zetaproteobacteria bacterium CG_4_9_14_3_um_filter_49_83]|nr:MAG: hypothetical protein COW62_10365 [Zetaproteobacteria bacterium CG17_big_fil_post_rev_8_21_14_2_50_50_13]PIV29125.1 MAG: hypothetical protein COS35_13735 [Zetaproteobacteria bacterium CG02_land_8_20_14_3_00_50_9]PJA35511.1 MAG: hypothetical protein CO186_05825 [Zetaproteobacteria bacterium CG_4_9_14_3_um_filter_49_83]
MFFAEAKLRRCGRTDQPMCGECTDCFLSYDDIDALKNDLLRIRSQFGGVDSGNYVRFEQAWDTPRAASANLHEPLRRIGEAVEKIFSSDPRAEALMVRKTGKQGHARYGILADKSQIRIERE